MGCAPLIPLPLRAALLRKTARLMQPPNFRPQIKLVILSVPTNSPQLEQYNRDRRKQCKKGAPPKPNVSGFGGERRSSGTTELLPRKAKRRMWSLRRRGTPFSPIFLQTKKDGATGGRWFSREVGKKRATKDGVPEGRWISSAASKTVKNKTRAPEGRSEKRMQVKT